MRAKRSKQYRKLMQRYGQTFGFREPYQVLVDAEVLLDAARFKMNFGALLEGTLHGKVKPMITQCCIRHLYETTPKDALVELVIKHAKDFERRRCNHHELEKPLTAMECISSVVDPKDNRRNKNRYIVATQNDKIRSYLRTIPGVPLIYIKRSVMIMEPMALASEQVRDIEEKTKIRGQDAVDARAQRKRKRGDEQTNGSDVGEIDEQEKPGKHRRGPKGPNPLSVPKPKKRPTVREVPSLPATMNEQEQAESNEAESAKRRRKRRHHTSKESASAADSANDGNGETQP